MGYGNSFTTGGSKIILGHRRKKDNQIRALEFRNQEYQNKMFRLNEEIDDLIKNRLVTRRGYFDNMLCFIKKNSEEIHPYYVIRCQYRQLEKHKH